MPTVDVRALGRRKKLMDDFSVPLPPGEGDQSRTLRDLIEQVVRSEVASFRQRQEENKFLRVLSSAQIADAAERGKVLSGGSEVEPQAVDEEDAIAVALQAFEDGIYYVVIDGQQITTLDAEVRATEDSRVTFLRLTLLAGG